MPLVFAVIFVIFIALWLSRKARKSDWVNAQRTRDKINAAKTNVFMERKLVDTFLKKGLSFDDAYEAAQKQLYENGYEPHLPKDAFASHKSYGYSSKTFYKDRVGIFEYDSQIIYEHHRQVQSYMQMWTKVYGNMPLPYSYDELVYTQLSPFMTAARKNFYYRKYQIGQQVYYKTSGLATIISYSHEDIDNLSFDYVVKLSRTGDIIYVDNNEALSAFSLVQ